MSLVFLSLPLSFMEYATESILTLLLSLPPSSSSITCAPDQTVEECSPDDCYSRAPVLVSIYLVFNQAYNLLIILIIKYVGAVRYPCGVGCGCFLQCK